MTSLEGGGSDLGELSFFPWILACGVSFSYNLSSTVSIFLPSGLPFSTGLPRPAPVPALDFFDSFQKNLVVRKLFSPL
jgi:hypothetical protein